MPLDALFLKSLCAQLAEQTVNARIDKIHMPSRDEVILTLRTAADGNRRLLISAGTTPRVNFTSSPAENPAQPPMFCMLLRKHLSGARIVSVSQPPMERLLTFELDCRDDLGRPCSRKLIAELVPRRANIIMTDQEGLIIDCLSRIDIEMSRRHVLPGLFYKLPPFPDKANPFAFSLDELEDLLKFNPDTSKPEKVLLDKFIGLSPAVCAELAFRSAFSKVSLAKEVNFLKALHPGGYLLSENGEPTDFSVIAFTGRGNPEENQHFDDLSQLLETFYGQKTRAARLNNASRDSLRAVKSARDKAKKRLEARKLEIVEVHDREHLRQMGDIITSNIHMISRAQNKLVAENFYEDGSPKIEIKLDPMLSPQQNAAKLYKEYSRRKTAEKHLLRLIAEDEASIQYLGSVLDELDRASGETDLAEIRAELRDAGIIKSNGSKKESKPKPLKPLSFTSPSGFEIFVGKNNRQNDQLTFKMAGKGDLWFHTQKIHGSHVVMFCRGSRPENDDILYASALAAGHSQAASGDNVPVDYTLIKNVKKPAGGRAGMVIYDNFKTYFVTPLSE